MPYQAAVGLLADPKVLFLGGSSPRVVFDPASAKSASFFFAALRMTGESLALLGTARLRQEPGFDCATGYRSRYR